jgi:hypothetical protein
MQQLAQVLFVKPSDAIQFGNFANIEHHDLHWL